MLQDVVKKVVKPPYKKETAVGLVDNYRVSARRAYRCVGLSKSMYYYRSPPRVDALLKMRITGIAHTRVRYGFARIFVLLPRAVFADNYKRVYYVYRACRLDLRTKRPGATMAIHRLGRQETQAINQVWHMDFVQDALFNGERFRVLTVEDNCSKIRLCLLVGNRSREQTW